MHVIFSDYYKGVGIIAGGPYWCAEGEVNKAYYDCSMTPDIINITKIEEKVNESYELKFIDNP
jgi:hypothetical protein